ncbi:MAG: DUF5667 domain-containing protein [Anaerolineae bacterium]|nr:DUF5667 domain-containing protein [Anaerolineae bacterium]
MKNQHHDPLITEEMPTVVRQGLQQLRETPPPVPASWQAARAAFLTEARQLTSESVTFAPVVRRKSWVAKTFHTLIPSFKEANPMVVLLKIALIVSLMTGASAGAIAAAQNSLPGSPLYPMKIAWENTQARLAATPEARLEQALTMAQVRVAEMVQLAERGQDIPNQTVERYELHLNAAIQAMGELPEPTQTQTRAQIQEQLALHEQILAQIRERLQEHAAGAAPGAAPETPLREMDGILKRSRDRLQDPHGDPPAIRPPDPQRTPNPDVPAPGPGEPNPAEPAPGAGEPGGGPGPNPTAPGAGPGPDPTEVAPGPGEPGAGPGDPTPEPPPVEPTLAPNEPGVGPGEPGAGPGPNPTEAGPTTTPGPQHP